MYSLPTYVETKDGRRFDITDQGDYRVILRCFEACNDIELASEDERVLACFLIFYNEFNCFEDLLKLDKDTVVELSEFMFKFFNCGDIDIKSNTGRRPLFNWQDDSQMIVSAINNVAKTEIRAVPYLHWWTFMGYYMSIGESLFATVTNIRDKMIKGKKLENYEREFKQNNPQYFVWNTKSVEELEADEYIKSIWNGGVNNG